MRVVRASLALVVAAASACATFTATDTQLTDGGAPDAATVIEASPPDAPGGAHFCANKTLSADHACFDFDDGALPTAATGWLIVQKGADMMTVIPGGAHASPFALALAGQRVAGGVPSGAAIRRALGGPRPSALTAAFSAQRTFVHGATNDGSQNYDLLVVKGSNATQTDHFQLELRPDGKLNMLEVVTENASGVATYKVELASLDVPALGQRFTDIALTVSFPTGDSSRATLTVGGMPAASGNAQFHFMTSIDDVTWGDSALSEGVDYQTAIDDLTLDVTP